MAVQHLHFIDHFKLLLTLVMSQAAIGKDNLNVRLAEEYCFCCDLYHEGTLQEKMMTRRVAVTHGSYLLHATNNCKKEQNPKK